MKFMLGDYEAVHREPVWRERSSFVFAAHLGVADGRNEWEQLWGEKVGPTRFILRCIPFFAYDLSLGDEVETDPDFVVSRVVRAGGQATFRLWFEGQDAATRDETLTDLGEMGCVSERSSENLVAISIADVRAQEVADRLATWERCGRLEYETGRR